MKHRLVLFSALVALVFFGITAPRMLRLDSPDFKVFHVAAKHALYQPENLYKISPDRYLYPPSTALLLAPFGFTDSWRFHQWSWHLVISLVVFFLAKQSWFFFFGILCLNRYLAINFGYGQINPLLLLMVFVTSRSLALNKSWAALTWPLASILKVYPLVQGIEFLHRRRWRELALAAAMFLLLLFLPFVFWPVDLAIELHRQFFQALEAKGLPTDSGNQSLLALFVRFFTLQPFQLHPFGEVQWGFATISRDLLSVAFFAVAGISLFFTWKKAIARKLALDSAAAMGFSLIFLSHIVWKDYFIFLLFPLVQFLELKPARWKGIIGVYLAMVYLSSPEIITHYWSARLDAINIHYWAAIWIWVHWLCLNPAPEKQN